jgi:hypothetical protein
MLNQTQIRISTKYSTNEILSYSHQTVTSEKYVAMPACSTGCKMYEH